METDYVDELPQCGKFFDLQVLQGSSWGKVAAVLKDVPFVKSLLEAIESDVVDTKDTISFYCDTFKEIPFSE